jgi:hypothetical protein
MLAVSDASPRSAPNGIERAPVGKKVLMNSTNYQPLNLNNDELALLTELLESERTKLLVEIRHADHRAFREELRRRLAVVENLLAHCRPS